MKEISKKDYNKCKNAVRSAIRQQFSRSAHYKAFKDSKKVYWKKKTISPNFKVSYRKRVSYECACCKELHPGSEINVDHIEPIGYGVFGDIKDAALFYELVYCPHDNLQILCKGCHDKKTKKENKDRSFDNASF